MSEGLGWPIIALWTAAASGLHTLAVGLAAQAFPTGTAAETAGPRWATRLWVLRVGSRPLTGQGSQRAGSPGPGDGGAVRAEPPYKGRSPRTLEARLAGAAGQEMFVLGELVMLEPDPKLLDPALPSASSLPGALDWADRRGRESQVERGRFPCHRPPHPSLGLPPRLTEPCPAGDGHPRESSPFISHGEADTESVYEGKNMALFEVNLTSPSEREVAGEAVLHTRGPTLASR